MRFAEGQEEPCVYGFLSEWKDTGFIPRFVGGSCNSLHPVVMSVKVVVEKCVVFGFKSSAVELS